MQVRTSDENECFWVIFLNVSTEPKVRLRQWEELKERKQMLGDKWIIGGDFNDIWNNVEKQGGRLRQESSFRDFRNFISTMGMGEVKFTSESYT